MKKSALIKLSAFIITLVLCISLGMPLAYAADDSEIPAQAAPAQVETPVPETPEQSLPEPADATAAVTDAETGVAAFKSQILALVNVEREKVGVPPLVEMDALAVLADTRAQESAVSFSHYRPNGTRCFTIFKENALSYWVAGENLAFGFNSPEDFVQAWMNSPLHRQNLLDPDFTFIGIGYYENSANGKLYCSQLFYTPKSTIVTPVAYW